LVYHTSSKKENAKITPSGEGISPVIPPVQGIDHLSGYVDNIIVTRKEKEEKEGLLERAV
jgi:hypothetical protein